MKAIHAFIILFAFILTGCGTLQATKAPNAPSRGEVGQLKKVQYGVIKEVRPLVIAGTQSTSTKVMGAIVGGALGLVAGDGASRILLAAAGGFAGSKVAGYVEEKSTKRAGAELIIQTDKHETVSILQDVVDASHMPGARVEISTFGDNTRIRVL